jgi:radical SAM/Cys-rich protein
MGEVPARGVLPVSRLPTPAEQLRVLAEVPLSSARGDQADFDVELAAHGTGGLRPGRLEVFQINVGRLCNMACLHCHVAAGPQRRDEVMSRETAAACLAAIDRSEARTVDLTGGAPELNPSFRFLVDEARRRGKHVIDRCNLTVLLTPGSEDLPAWLAERDVEIVASLPHYRARNTDAQRGNGAFARSIAALRRLNEVGYGTGDERRRLTLMVNPAGAFLAGRQSELEPEWKQALAREHGVAIDGLVVLNNMPISRFLIWLRERDNLQRYLQRLVDSFNPATVPGLMCRNMLSISWDGRIFDCDFNQMLNLECDLPGGLTPHVRDFEPELYASRRIRTARHCFGCTAGAGSSCGGALSE